MSEDKKQPLEDTVNELSQTTSGTKNAFPLIGETIGKVILEEGIKSGAMSTVYKGRDKRTDDPIIMKILQQKQAENKEMKHRFLQDGEITEALDHPNIVKTRRKGEDKGVAFIAYDFIPNARDLTEMTNLTVTEKAEILRGVARALKHAHANGAIHRDVKPDNILVDRMADPIRAVLLDWGIAKNEVSDSETITVFEGVMGTPYFLSPEQAADPGNVDGKTDLYGLACTAYAIHTGMAPQEVYDTNVKGIQRNMNAITQRKDKTLPISTWFQEALHERRSKLEKHIEEGTGDVKKKRRRLEKDILPVSDDYAELWNVYLAAKDPTDRPNIDVLLSRLDELIDNQRIEPHALSEAEQAQRVKKREQLKKQVEDLEAKKDEVQRGNYSDDVFDVTQDLALVYDELVELTDHGSSEREKFVRKASHYYQETHTILRFDEKRIALLEMPKEALMNKIQWYGALENYFNVRKLQKSSSKRQSTTMLELGDVIKLAGEEDYISAASKLKTISVRDIPTEHQSKIVEMKSELEKQITTILGEGRLHLAEGNYDAAREAYTQARTMSDALDAPMKRQRAANFFVDIEKTRYDLAESQGDFYTMLDCGLSIVELGKTLPSSEKESVDKIAEEMIKSLGRKKNQNYSMRTFIKSLDNLEEEYDAAVQDAGEDGLDDDERKEFQELINEQFDTFKPLKKRNIGPTYDVVKRRLVDLTEDIEAPSYKKHIDSSDPELREKSLQRLRKHYLRHMFIDEALAVTRQYLTFLETSAQDLADVSEGNL